MKHHLPLVLLPTLLLLPTPAPAADIFYYTSSPSSWVGHGATQTYNTVSFYRYYNQGAYTNSLHFGAGGFDLALVAPNYTVPYVGSFPNATRWPFMDNGAGLDFSGNGRGDNTLSGSFDVFEAVYKPDGSVLSFAADFVQYDEKNLAAWNRGSVRYNSSVPIPAPEPTTLTLLLPAATALAARRRRR